MLMRKLKGSGCEPQFYSKVLVRSIFQLHFHLEENKSSVEPSDESLNHGAALIIVGTLLVRTLMGILIQRWRLEFKVSVIKYSLLDDCRSLNA